MLISLSCGNGAAAKLLQSCPTLCDPMDCSRLLHPWDFPGKSTGAATLAYMKTRRAETPTRSICKNLVSAHTHRSEKFVKGVGVSPAFK